MNLQSFIKKSNCQAFKLSLCIFHYIVLFHWVHIQRKIRRKPAQLFGNSTKLCEIYFDNSVKNRNFETRLNRSLPHSTPGASCSKVG